MRSWGGRFGWKEEGHLPVSLMMEWSHFFDQNVTSSISVSHLSNENGVIPIY
jgi:hypothetical protein